jgi:O-antigen ligase
MRAAITERLPAVGWAAVLVAFAAVPVVFLRSTFDIFNVVKITVVWLAVIVALACWIGWSASRRRWVPMPWVAVPVAVFLALTVLATALSVSPAISFLGQYRRYDGLSSLLAYAALALMVVAYTWEEPARLRHLVVAGVAGGAATAAYVLVQEAGLDPWSWLDSRGREPTDTLGPLGNSNFTGAYLALCVPLVLGWRATLIDRWQRRALVGLAAGLTLGVWLAQSRGGFVALLGGVAVAGLFDRRTVPRLVTMGAGLAATAGLVLVLTFVVGGSVPVPGASGGEQSVTGTSTLESRARLWEGALGVIAAHPLVGTGPDTFLVAYPPHRPFDDGASIELAADEPHNILLDHAAGRGVAALVTYLVVMGATFAYAWRRRATLAPTTRPLAAAFAGLLAAYLLQGLTSLDAPPLALAGWLAVGALAALTDPRIDDARAEAESASSAKARSPRNTATATARPLTLIALLALGGGVIAAGVVAARPLVADARYRQGIASADAQALASAASWNPLEPTYEVRQAQYWQQLADGPDVNDETRRGYYRAGWPHFERALELLPGNPFTLRDAAAFQSAWASFDPQQFDDADALYDEALAIDPNNWQIRGDYANLLEAWAVAGDDTALRERAIAQLERVVELRPVFTDGWLQLAVLYEATDRVDEATAVLNEALALDPDDAAVAEVADAFVAAHPTAALDR